MSSSCASISFWDGCCGFAGVVFCGEGGGVCSSRWRLRGIIACFGNGVNIVGVCRGVVEEAVDYIWRERRCIVHVVLSGGRAAAGERAERGSKEEARVAAHGLPAGGECGGHEVGVILEFRAVDCAFHCIVWSFWGWFLASSLVMRFQYAGAHRHALMISVHECAQSPVSHVGSEFEWLFGIRSIEYGGGLYWGCCIFRGVICVRCMLNRNSAEYVNT
eukprot:3934519-Rhodomonas_salina.1